MSNYTYESPDGGKTVYRRKSGESTREVVGENHYEQSLLHRQLWYRIHEAAKTDPALKEMLDEIEIYFNLKHQ